MSSRALRQLQREREQRAQIEKLRQEADAGDDEDAPATEQKKSAFALLGELNQDDNDEDEDSDDENEDIIGKRVEQKNTNTDGVSGEVSEDLASKESIKKSKKSKKKKKKKAAAKSHNTPIEDNDEDIDEIDRALKELGTDTGPQSTATAQIDATRIKNNARLAVDTHHLHPENEMRRLFGRDANNNAADEDNDNAATRRGGIAAVAANARASGPGGRIAGLSAVIRRKNPFVQGKEDWPPWTGGGLALVVDPEKNDDDMKESDSGVTHFLFLHSGTYAATQREFTRTVESYDPQRLVVLLQNHPYHIATLLQVSEIARTHDHDAALAGTLLERALFACGRAANTNFARALSAGTARLRFRYRSNRDFFLAGWRYMRVLASRALWRSAFEWAKLLLACSPEDDPYALWLVIDTYALRAHQNDAWDKLRVIAPSNEPNPNFAFSRGLADLRDDASRKQTLFRAVQTYPWVAAQLFSSLNLDPPPTIWGKQPPSEAHALLSALYVHTAGDLWAAPEISATLVEVSAAVSPEYKPITPLKPITITLAMARHVLLLDVPHLTALLPRQFTEAYHSSADPLPPADDPDANLVSVNSLEPSIRSLREQQDNFERMFAGMLADTPEGPEGDYERAQLRHFREGWHNEQVGQE